MSDYLPTASLKNLQLRADLLARTRQFFAAHGFLEVETPILSADVTVDRHLDPLSTILASDPRQPDVGRRLWLQTSPEFGMKRLLAAGATAIYQITRAFRNGEIGPLHNPEFTMIEWYRVGDDMRAGMNLLSDLCQELLNSAEAEQLNYAEAFQKHLGINPHTVSVAQLTATASQRSIAVPAGLNENRDDWLNLLLAECIEPNLGQQCPTILYDYPASQAALAKIRPASPTSSTTSGESSSVPVARALRALCSRHRAGQRLSRTARRRRVTSPKYRSQRRTAGGWQTSIAGRQSIVVGHGCRSASMYGGCFRF